MLNKFKEYVYELLIRYYRNKADYCYRKVDEYGPEHNEYWGTKLIKYTFKELDMHIKLVKLQEVDR